MKAHVLITSNETFPVCRDRLFWGIGVEDCPNEFEKWLSPANSKKAYLKMLVDMMGIDIGDLVFLYERQVGFHGVYKVKDALFFDTTRVCDSGGRVVGEHWPLRITLECLYYFPRAVAEDLLFSTPHYESVFWIWTYRKNQGPRGCNTITPEATEALVELLVKVNGAAGVYEGLEKYAPDASKRVEFCLRRVDERLALEDFLRGYLLARIGNGNELDDIFGPREDIEWVGNNVPYHISRKNIDLLAFHTNLKYTAVPLRYKYSVVELKKDTVQARDVSQVLQYSRWVAGRLANGEVEMVQPILVAYDFSRAALRKAKDQEFNKTGIILAKYRAVSENNLTFGRV